jgi:hypothetical protein
MSGKPVSVAVGTPIFNAFSRPAGQSPPEVKILRVP